MMDYQVNNDVLTVNGNRIQFNDKIDKVLEIDNKLIILLDQEENNVYAVDQYGNILWRIQDAREELFQEPGRKAEMYLEIRFKENKLLAYRNVGGIFEVNPENGKIKMVVIPGRPW